MNPSRPLIIDVYKRDYETLDEYNAKEASRYKFEDIVKANGIKRKITRFIYKILRMFYGSWVFYFMPYTTLFLPYCVEYSRIS